MIMNTKNAGSLTSVTIHFLLQIRSAGELTVKGGE
jgi:hypothetical protein